MTRDAVAPPSSAPPSVEDVLSLQRDVIAQLIRSPALAQGDLSEAIRLVTESAARLVDVRRASVWRFDETRTRIGGVAPVYVTVSSGIAARRAGESLDDVLRRADEALYQGKQAGRIRVVVSE